jgi:hypothetical protein
MLRKSRRPRDKRISRLTPVTYSIEEFCDIDGLSGASGCRSIDEGSLCVMKLGHRHLILVQQLQRRSSRELLRPASAVSSFRAFAANPSGL